MSAVPVALVEEFRAWETMQPGASGRRWDLYRRLRHEAPRYRSGAKIYFSLYEDCKEILSNSQTYRNGFDPHGPVARGVREYLSADQQQRYDAVLDHQLRWLTSRNGVSHSALRNLANRVFTPGAISAMQNRIQREIDDRLEELDPRESFDIISEFAFQLPLTIISEMLDIPVDLRDSIHESWVSMTGIVGAASEQIPDFIDKAYEGMRQLEDRMREVISLRRGARTTDLLTRLLAAQEDEKGITEADIIGVVTQMVIAGHQTTQDTIGSALFELLSSRHKWEALCGDRALIPNTVEEVLRFRTPGQMIGRTVAKDTKLGDADLQEGEQVICLLASANRDEGIFSNPDDFEIKRENAKLHMSFSRGSHFCLGAALSRMEVTCFLTTLAQRYPKVQMLQSEVEWIPNNFLLGIRELQISLGPKSGA